MEGGHVTLAGLAEAAVAEHGPPAVVIGSSMLNLPAFLGAARGFLGDPAVVCYMHENQLTYPASHLAQEDLTHALINWASVATADAVWFNSAFHRDDFFGAVGELLGRFPDFRHDALIRPAQERSSVMPVGMDLRRLDDVAATRHEPPLILWNQRWEHDKNPGEFFAAIDQLVAGGVPFRLALAGETFSTIPGVFEEARDRLGERVVHFGYAPADDYVRLLRSADVVVATSHHEFFGVAILEAIYAGARPVLPNRLAYPGHIPAHLHDLVLYGDFDGLVRLLEQAVADPRGIDLREAVGRYDWSVVAPAYDSAIESLVM